MVDNLSDMSYHIIIKPYSTLATAMAIMITLTILVSLAAGTRSYKSIPPFRQDLRTKKRRKRGKLNSLHQTNNPFSSLYFSMYFLLFDSWYVVSSQSYCYCYYLSIDILRLRWIVGCGEWKWEWN